TIAKTVDHTTVERGDAVTYTITIHNGTTGAVTVRRVVDLLPRKFPVVASSSAGGGGPQGCAQPRPTHRGAQPAEPTPHLPPPPTFPLHDALPIYDREDRRPHDRRARRRGHVHDHDPQRDYRRRDGAAGRRPAAAQVPVRGELLGGRRAPEGALRASPDHVAT